GGPGPVGRGREAGVARCSAHGAYVVVGGTRAYVPLRNLADPPPRSAKEVLSLGESRRFVVVSVDPPRRGIDLAIPGVVDVPAPVPVGDAELEAVADAASAAEPPGTRRSEEHTSELQS